MTIQLIFVGAEKMVFDSITDLDVTADAFGKFDVRFMNKDGNRVTARGVDSYVLTRF